MEPSKNNLHHNNANNADGRAQPQPRHSNPTEPAANLMKLETQHAQGQKQYITRRTQKHPNYSIRQKIR